MLRTARLEGLFGFPIQLASLLTDRFGINYAYAGVMARRIRIRSLIYSVFVKS